MYIEQEFTCPLLSGDFVYVVTPMELMNYFNNNKFGKLM